MPKGLEKTRKSISKKKGSITALHENSRDSQRLRRAHGRDEKLERIAIARRKADQPLLERVKFFQNAVQNKNVSALNLEASMALIKSFLSQRSEELCGFKKERKPGRPPSTREDLIRMKIAAEEKEYRDGFYMPDLTDETNLVYLTKWEGAWSFLPNLKWVRISSTGRVQMSKFPPKGDT